MCKKYQWKLGRFGKGLFETIREKSSSSFLLGKTTTHLGWLSPPNQAGEGIGLLSVAPFGEVNLRQKRTAGNKELTKCWHKTSFLPQVLKMRMLSAWKLKFWNTLPAWAEGQKHYHWNSLIIKGIKWGSCFRERGNWFNATKSLSEADNAMLHFSITVTQVNSSWVNPGHR